MWRLIFPQFLALIPPVGLAAFAAQQVRGHGNPVQIDGASGALVVTTGLPLGDGFASQAFDPSEEAGLDFPGATVRTDLPGYDPRNIAASTLTLEIFSRRDQSSIEAPPRWLWYWDPQTAAVEIAVDDPDFQIRRKDLGGQVTFDQFDGTTANLLQLTESLVQNAHSHFVQYALDNVPAANPGVYAFFGRLSAPGYASSEPIMWAFGYGLAVEQQAALYAAGASAINLEAGVAADFDAAGAVDGLDFLLWQRSVGQTGSPGAYSAADGNLDGLVNGADLAIWSQRFGWSRPLPSNVLALPEPATGSLAAAAAIGAATCRLRRARRFPYAPKAELI